MTPLEVTKTYNLTSDIEISILRSKETHKLRRLFLTKRNSFFSFTSIAIEAEKFPELIQILQDEQQKGVT